MDLSRLQPGRVPAALLLGGYWRWSYALFGALAILVYFWNASILEDKKQHSPGVAPKIFNVSSLKKTVFLIAASLGVGFSSSLYWTFSRSYITVVHGLPTGSFGNSALYFHLDGPSFYRDLFFSHPLRDIIYLHDRLVYRMGHPLGSIAAGLIIEGISYPFAFILFSAVGVLFIFCKTVIASPSAAAGEAK